MVLWQTGSEVIFLIPHLTPILYVTSTNGTLDISCFTTERWHSKTRNDAIYPAATRDDRLLGQEDINNGLASNKIK